MCVWEVYGVCVGGFMVYVCMRLASSNHSHSCAKHTIHIHTHTILIHTQTHTHTHTLTHTHTHTHTHTTDSLYGRHCVIPLSFLVSLLKFNTELEAGDFCELHGLEVYEEEGGVWCVAMTKVWGRVEGKVCMRMYLCLGMSMCVCGVEGCECVYVCGMCFCCW